MMLQQTALHTLQFTHLQVFYAVYLKRGATEKGNSIKLLLVVRSHNFSKTTRAQSSYKRTGRDEVRKGLVKQGVYNGKEGEVVNIDDQPKEFVPEASNIFKGNRKTRWAKESHQ